MSGEEWRPDIIAASVEVFGEIPQSLRCVAAAMEQKHPMPAACVLKIDFTGPDDDPVLIEPDASCHVVTQSQSSVA